MEKQIVKKLNNLKRQKRSVRLVTKHHDGDAYDGIVLACKPKLILLQIINDFKLGGVLALQTGFLKGLRLGRFERLLDKVIAQNRQIRKLKRIPWLMKVENIPQMILECHRRKIWPIVEMQSNSKNAFFIGPITQVSEKEFNLFSYDADGKWEKIYRLPYKEVIRVEIFDDYSKHFNRYMVKKLPNK